MDAVYLASVFRLTATNFRMSAEVLQQEMASRGECLPGNIRAIPFYYLMSHAVELLLKTALLKRGVSSDELKRYQLGHRLDKLLKVLIDRGVPLSDDTVQIVDLLSEQHARHVLRYSALKEGEPIFTPEPSSIFAACDELLLAGRTGQSASAGAAPGWLS